MQVDDDPVAVGKRLGDGARAATRREGAIELVELGCDGGEALAGGVGACLRRAPFAEGVVLGEASRLGRRELRLLLPTLRLRDRAAGGRGLELDALQPLERGHEDRRLAEEGCARRAVARGTHVEAAAE